MSFVHWVGAETQYYGRINQKGRGVAGDKAIVRIQGAQIFTVLEITLKAWIGKRRPDVLGCYDNIPGERQ